MQSEIGTSKYCGSQVTARTHALTRCWNAASPVGRPPGTRVPSAAQTTVGPPSLVVPASVGPTVVGASGAALASAGGASLSPPGGGACASGFGLPSRLPADPA